MYLLSFIGYVSLLGWCGHLTRFFSACGTDLIVPFADVGESDKKIINGVTFIEKGYIHKKCYKRSIK